VSSTSFHIDNEIGKACRSGCKRHSAARRDRKAREGARVPSPATNAWRRRTSQKRDLYFRSGQPAVLTPTHVPPMEVMEHTEEGGDAVKEAYVLRR